jgi:small-conductance mechanosensitive channel
MKTILEQNSEVVRQAGKALVKIGADLAAGQIDDALDKLETAKQEFREWVELDKAIADIEKAEQDQYSKQAVQLVLVKLVGSILATAILRPSES